MLGSDRKFVCGHSALAVALLLCVQSGCSNDDTQIQSWSGSGKTESQQPPNAKRLEQPEPQCFLITNGIKANPSEWPAIALVKRDTSTGSNSCTGTMVGPDVVLTAAHCLDSAQTNAAAPINGMTVVVNGLASAVERVFFPRWAGTQNSMIGFDLAILQLADKTNKAYYPIALKPPEIRQEFQIAGYGSWFADYGTKAGNNPDMALYFGKNKIVGLDRGLIWSYGESGAAIQSEPGQNSVAASGDSGGPLLIEKTLVGVESFGTGTLDAQFFDLPVPPLSETPSHSTFESDAIALQHRIPEFAKIEQSVRDGRKLSLDAYMNLTSKVYHDWLRELAAQGLEIQFADPLEPKSPPSGSVDPGIPESSGHCDER